MGLKALLGNDLIEDVRRPPNAKERAAFEKRRARVVKAERTRTTAVANASELVDRGQLTALRIRHGFIRLHLPLAETTSDRKAPPRKQRPPSTRLITPNGIALRLMLIALLEAQSRTAPGTRADGTPLPLRAERATELGWTTLLSTSAESSGQGKHRMSVRDKQLRQVQDTLKGLEDNSLIEPRDPAATKGRYDGFFLMSEDVLFGEVGNRYSVPDDSESYFEVPLTLFTQGWVHVLEDSELALLLMTARMHHRHGDKPQKLRAAIRVRHYGLGRDAFEAHMMLSRLGLIDVTEDIDRHEDGTVRNYDASKGAQPHELLFLPGGLEQDAGQAVLDQLDYQLSR